MHIGIISPSYPSNISTESVFVEAIVNEFVALGHKCTIIAPFTVFTYLRGRRVYGLRYEKRIVHNSTVEVFKPRVYGIKDYPIFGISNSRYQETLAIERTIKRNNLKFDVIYCHFFAQGFSAFRYASKHGIPLFVATGESTIPNLNPPYRGFSVSAFREYLSGTICVSTKNRDECVSIGYSTKEKCIVIPNAVDLNLFKLDFGKKKLREELGLPLDKTIAVCVGEFSDRKGQNRIINAIAFLNNPNVSLILIGKSLSNNFSLLQHPCVVFTGSVPHMDLPKYLHASDFFVLPTLREGCCNAIIEAMACGLPIVSSNLPFNHDILSTENSILVNPESISEIADGINRLYLDVCLRQRLSKLSYMTASELSISHRANRIINFIKSKIYAVTQNTTV